MKSDSDEPQTIFEAFGHTAQCAKWVEHKFIIMLSPTIECSCGGQEEKPKLHPSHSPDANGDYCVRCSVIVSEAAGKLPCIHAPKTPAVKGCAWDMKWGAPPHARYETECGQNFRTNKHSIPYENGFQYCPYCGSVIILVPKVINGSQDSVEKPV